MNKLTQQAAEHWRFVAPLLSKPTCEADYQALVEALDELLDVVGDDESHSLAGLVEHLGDLVSAYETVHNSMPEGDGRSALAFLMQQHGLGQADLPEVGAQSVVSDVLSGKRRLNVRQIRELARRFGVSVETFF